MTAFIVAIFFKLKQRNNTVKEMGDEGAPKGGFTDLTCDLTMSSRWRPKLLSETRNALPFFLTTPLVIMLDDSHSEGSLNPASRSPIRQKYDSILAYQNENPTKKQSLIE